MPRIISPPRVVSLPACLLVSLTLFGGGCAHYEYDVVEPADHAQHIGTKAPVEIPREPLRYQAQTSSDHLVLLINNETQDPVKLLGEDSFAVDPNGESHSVPTRTIAPGTSMKLILPPVKPTFRETGPHYGVGFGVGVAHSYGRKGYTAGGFAGDPWYYDDYPPLLPPRGRRHAVLELDRRQDRRAPKARLPARGQTGEVPPRLHVPAGEDVSARIRQAD